jgi:4-hydroxybenzoate polyprenyltransferase
LGQWDVSAITGFYLVYLLIWAFLLDGASRGFWFGLGWLTAMAQVAWHIRLIKDRTREGCFKAFRLNHWLGFSVFVGVAMSYQ